MPRSRRRHYSRSRSRSHSHDRDREAKRRRIESPDSHQRRSVSVDSDDVKRQEPVRSPEAVESSDDSKKPEESQKKLESADESNASINNITPKKTMSPMQSQKKMNSEKKREDKQKERERSKQEKEEQKLKERKEKEEQRKKEKEEKEELKRKEREEKEKQKQEKEEQKRKEREEKEEQKRKEREEKEEQKRKEKEEKEEQKRKEREEKELKKQQEIDEKNKEKKKKEEQYKREQAAFANFFVTSKKSTVPVETKKPEVKTFMPFEIKCDMRLAPVTRNHISDEQKKRLIDKLLSQNDSVFYLTELKNGKKLGTSARTWSIEDNDDVIIIEDTGIGECVEEQSKSKKMRAKLLKFHENRRPAYFGTWRKKSYKIKARNPYVLDKELFDYDVDSDDDWEEEEPGESLRGSDDEDKDNETDDYEVDNDFFVPHGYLSDEEIEAEEENVKLSPETQKEKLKLLQLEFDEEMKSKTERMKPRLIGCIWDNKLVPKVHDAISRFLEDRMMIVNERIIIQKIDSFVTPKQNTPGRKQLDENLIPDFVKLVHGNMKRKRFIVHEFISYLQSKELEVTVSKAGLILLLNQIAKWQKCPDEGSMFNKFCWYVSDEIRNKYNLDLTLPNKWLYISKMDENINISKKLPI